MDPVTFLLITYIGSLFVSQKVRAVTADAGRAVAAGVRWAVQGESKPPQGRSPKSSAPPPKQPAYQSPNPSPERDAPGAGAKGEAKDGRGTGARPRRGRTGDTRGSSSGPSSDRARGRDTVPTTKRPRPLIGVTVNAPRTTVTVTPAPKTVPAPAPVPTPPPPPAPSQPTPEEHPVSTQTVPTAENIPAHMDASDALAAMITDLADTLRALVDTATRHMEAAESLGITGSVLGGFSVTADAVRAPVAALTAAADTGIVDHPGGAMPGAKQRNLATHAAPSAGYCHNLAFKHAHGGESFPV